jgi:glycosyltransferase involved in cell wall biosynthesis
VLRVAYITNYYPETGGMPDYAANLIKSTSPLLEDDIIISRGTKKSGSGNVLPIYNERSLGSVLKVKKAIKNFDPDLVHIQYSTFSFMPFLPLLTKNLDCPKLTTAHEVLVSDGKRMYKNAPKRSEIFYKNSIFLYDKIYYKTVDEVIVHTEFLRDRLISAQKIASNRIHLIPHGADCTVTPKRHYELCNRILFMGTFTPHKGIETLLAAFNGLLEEGNNLQLVLIGPLFSGLKRRDIWYANLRKYIGNSKFKDSVLLTGYLSKEEVGNYMRSSDLIVLPYKEVGCSGVAPLAMSYGLPLIATRTGGFLNQIEEGKTGLLFEPNSIPELKQKMSLLLKNSDVREYIGRKEREYAEKYLDWKIIGQKHVELYRNMVFKD